MKRIKRFYHHRFDIFFNIKSKYHVRICNIGKHKLKFHHAQCGKELEFAFDSSKPMKSSLTTMSYLTTRIELSEFKKKNVFNSSNISKQSNAPPPRLHQHHTEIFDCLSYIHLQVTVCASEKRKKKDILKCLLFSAFTQAWSAIAGRGRLTLNTSLSF